MIPAADCNSSCVLFACQSNAFWCQNCHTHKNTILQDHQRFLPTTQNIDQVHTSLQCIDESAVYTVAFILSGVCLKIEMQWWACCSRMNFNQAEEEYIDGEDTVGLGTLGKEGSGRSVDNATSTAIATAYTRCMCVGSFMMSMVCHSI